MVGSAPFGRGKVALSGDIFEFASMTLSSQQPTTRGQISLPNAAANNSRTNFTSEHSLEEFPLPNTGANNSRTISLPNTASRRSSPRRTQTQQPTARGGFPFRTQKNPSVFSPFVLRKAQATSITIINNYITLYLEL
eukprot:GEMP01077406.1.p1 GENE.GEMP01077406.1~~GEMP01077406.1.p1  ORF type:complete len:137 (-),score=8.34 GEMP01077406.1:483-893(-)